MKDFLILILIFSGTITFAQNKTQLEPAKQSVESKDLKKEVKEVPASDAMESDKLDNAIDEELEALEEERDDVEMKEEEKDMKEEEEIKEEKGVKEKLKIQPEKNLKTTDE